MTPEYYGLEMFAQAAPQGSRLLSTTTTNAQGITVWATRGSEGRTRVVLINESLDRRTVAVGSAGDASGDARAAACACAQQHLAGSRSAARVSAHETTTGRLAGRSRIAKLNAIQGRYEFTLPAESAALVTY